MSHLPPRLFPLLEWMMRRVMSPAASSAAIGDIYEELEERFTGGRQPRWPWLWMHARAIRVLAAAIRTACERRGRLIALTVRDAAHAIRRAPRHTASILGVLTLGISAATITFSVVDAVVLRPLPFERSDRLMLIGGRMPGWPTALAAEEFWAIHDRVPALDGLGTLRMLPTPVSIGSLTNDLPVMRSTAGLFDVFRLQATVGRVWTAEEESRSEPTVAVLGYELWQRWFASDPAVVGRVITVGKTSYEVIGVLQPIPDGKRTLGWQADVWIPAVPPRQGDAVSVARTFVSIGRLRDGVGERELEAQITSALAPLAAAKPFGYREWKLDVRPWQTALVGDVRGWMLLLLGAVTLMVMIACANAANLMLTRSIERARELAVRTSLGASRGQLAVTLLVESLMISSAATAGALLLALWGVRAVKSALPPGIFRSDAIALNGRVFIAAAASALVTGILFGAIPAWQVSRVSIVTILKETGATSTPSRRGWRSLLLVGQIACIGILLVASTLFVGSFVRVIRADLGLDRTNLVGISASPGLKGTLEEVRTRLARQPGVTAVAGVTSSSLPLIGPAFGGAYADTKLRLDGAPETSTAQMLMYHVTANYFDVTGMRFRRGSTWRDDSIDAQPVVLDELAARRLFGDSDPIGRRVRGTAASDLYTVVGVTSTVWWRGPDQQARPTAYFPMSRGAKASGASYFVRAAMPAAAVVRELEAAVASAAAGSSPAVHVVDDAIRRITATRRFSAAVMGAFAVFAILIGAAGIYATISSVVAQQTHEIGVRLALGATGADIRRSVLMRTGASVALGLAIGLPLALWMSRGFATLLFQVGPTDPSIYLIVAVTVMLTAVAAALLPARRASRVDPLVSLRSV